MRMVNVPAVKWTRDCVVVSLFSLILLHAWQVRADAPSPVELPAHLSLEQAMEIFRTHGLDMLIADAAVLGAQGDLRAAGAIPNPQLSTNFGHVFNYSAANTAKMPCVGCSGPAPSTW